MAKQSLRIEYGKYLVELGKKYPQLMVLEADLQESTQSIHFKKAFPDRYIEVGIAEQNMTGIAAGLALSGKIPVTHSFACFTSMRACEQVRTTVAYPRLNVKFFVSHAGISAGTAGTTHHAIEDVGIMRSIPNMTVLIPGDVSELRQVVDAALIYNGPVYIRVSAIDVEDVYTETDKFVLGKATCLRSGNDGTIITTGIMMEYGVKAAEFLKNEHQIQVRVIQMASVKPIDKETVIQAIEETGKIVTVEEHNIIGGLGSAVSEIVAELGKGKVNRIGINDHFCGVGSAVCLFNQEGLTVENIVKTVSTLV